MAYSAIKIIAKPLLIYSTLKPETNSDSPSVKSKGVRLVSAKQEENQIRNKGKNITINHIFFWKVKILSKQKEEIKNNRDNTTKAKLTS